MPDDSPNILEMLRQVQDGGNAQRRMTFVEWEQEKVLKASGHRGTPIHPGAGMTGHLGTNSRGSTGPRDRPSGNHAVGLKQQFGVPALTSTEHPSRYASERLDQPPQWIDDVDMGATWYSPQEPVWPFGPPYYNRPREWNFPVGYNLNYIPERMALFGMLRGMRQSWGVLATVESTRMDQLLRMPWTIQRKDRPRATSAGVNEMRKFFRRPDGKLSYGQWSRKLLFDLFDLDAPCLFINRNRGGKPQAVECLDGATIFPLIDDAGRRPGTDAMIDSDGLTYIHRQPAFQQIIYGLPMVNLDETELIYAMMRPRPELPMFGYSPIEQILVEATEAIRKTFYQAEFWRSGSMPELIVTVPDNWTPRQIAMFQGHFDALLSGNLSLKSKVRFLPGGMKPFDIKNASGKSLWSERDELLVRLVCYAFSVSPTPFVRQMNRATAQNAQQTAQEEGLYPLMSWWKDDIMDRIIQEEHGFDAVESTYLPRPEVDQEKQSKIHQVQLREGMRTVNEVRDELGEEPVQEGNTLLIYTPAGAVPLSTAAKGQAFLPGQALPAKGSEQGSSTKPRESVQGQPQHGSPRPNNASTQPPSKPTTVHKFANWFLKVSAKDVRHAARESNGDIDRVSHLVQHVGNYKKGHIWIQGLNISIENEKGSLRGEKDQRGKKWQVKMPAPYGYIRGTIGADGMQVDVYLGKHPENPTLFVIDQDKVTPQGKVVDFDEHKVMLGYKTAKRAVKDWMKSHFDDFSKDRLSAVTEVSIVDFKAWLKSGDMKSPISTQNIGEVVLTKDDLSKADTISQSAGLLWHDQTTAVPRRKKKKAKKRRMGPKWLQLVSGAMLALFVSNSLFAAGPSTPSGAPSLNQAQYGAPITKSDTGTFPATRGIHVGDASACNLSVVFASNPGVAVSIDNVTSGTAYPYSIIQLKAATTCADIVGLW